MASKVSGSRERERTYGVTSSSFQNSQKGSRSSVQLSEKNIPGASLYGIVPLLFHGFIPRKLVEGKLLVSLRVRVAARHAASVASSHRLIFGSVSLTELPFEF